VFKQLLKYIKSKTTLNYYQHTKAHTFASTQGKTQSQLAKECAFSLLWQCLLPVGHMHQWTQLRRVCC